MQEVNFYSILSFHNLISKYQSKNKTTASQAPWLYFGPCKEQLIFMGLANNTFITYSFFNVHRHRARSYAFAICIRILCVLRKQVLFTLNKYSWRVWTPHRQLPTLDTKKCSMCLLSPHIQLRPMRVPFCSWEWNSLKAADFFLNWRQTLMLNHKPIVARTSLWTNVLWLDYERFFFLVVCFQFCLVLPFFSCQNSAPSAAAWLVDMYQV